MDDTPPSTSRRKLQPKIFLLRVGALVFAFLGLAVVGRIMTALSPSVDFVLAIVASLLFAHRFERSDDAKTES